MDPISRRYLDQVADAEDAYQAGDDPERTAALHRQVLALASLAAHQAEQIAALGRVLVGEGEPTGEVGEAVDSLPRLPTS